jgi:hypothetical protein
MRLSIIGVMTIAWWLASCGSADTASPGSGGPVGDAMGTGGGLGAGSDGGTGGAGAAERGTAASICTGCIYDSLKNRTDCLSPSARCKGTCGAGCDIQCSMGAVCDVTVEKGGKMECDTDAVDCKVTGADPTGLVECTGGVSCSISCKGPCTYDCKKAATCAVTCGAKSATTTTMTTAITTTTAGSCM